MTIVECQKANAKWSHRNATYFVNLGYPKLMNGEEFEVKIEHLTKGSNALILLECDNCGDKFKNKFSAIQKTKNHFCTRKCQDNFLIGKPSWNSKKIKVECSNCNLELERSEWELKRNNNFFCSKQCSDQYKVGRGQNRVERIKLKCNQCHIEIERTETELKRAKNHFCTKECSDGYMKGKSNLTLTNRVEIGCYTCSKLMSHIPSRVKNTERVFCSKECRKKWMATDEYSDILYRGGLIDVDCDSCGITFKKKRTVVYEHNFCSRKCHGKRQGEVFRLNNPNPKKEKIKVNCYTCDKEKLIPESVQKKNKYFFCSHNCYQEKRMEISDFKQTGTSIHLQINNLLNQLDIFHMNEKGFSYYSLDIFIPNNNVGIEIMGDYWHGSPCKYENILLLNNIQLKNISKDKRKNLILSKKFKTPILYLWEKDINQRLNVCKNLILKFINNDGLLENYDSFK